MKQQKHWNEQIVIKSTRIIIKYPRRAFRLHKTHQWRSNQNSNKAKQVQGWRVLRTLNSKIVVPNTAKVIFSWDKTIFSFPKIQSFVTGYLLKWPLNWYSCQHENGDYWAGDTSGTKRPPTVTSTKWCKLLSKVPGL